MTQIEFVTELEQALRGNVEERIIQENVMGIRNFFQHMKTTFCI